jgi:hypothetical protein
MIRSTPMLRHATLILVAIATGSTAFAADQTAPAKRHVAAQLPAGLPRPHYNHGTTIVYGAPPPPPVVYAARDPDSLISPMLPTTPILPGSSTLPGNYGRAFDYDYQGAYYGGGPYPSYFFRLPYACGVLGYC